MKADLRKTIVRKMKEQQLIVKQQRDALLTQYLLESSAYQQAGTVATYSSLPHEFDTRVLIPKTYPQGRMTFVDYNPNDLELTAFGIWEPRSERAVEKSHIDLIHVPGIAFNKKGYRIGYGGGYYDRYLADFKGMTVSTIYPYQLVDFQPDDCDIPVQEVLICE